MGLMVASVCFTCANAPRAVRKYTTPAYQHEQLHTHNHKDTINTTAYIRENISNRTRAYTTYTTGQAQGRDVGLYVSVSMPAALSPTVQ